MDILYMREVLVLAEHLNYTTAAAELYISQPTLTRHINAVENTLGAKLFHRTNHVVSLTECGTVAVKAFQHIVSEYDKLQDEVGSYADGAKTDLQLGMVYYGTTAYYGYPLLEAFSKRYPAIQVSTITAQTTQIYKHLHSGSIDVGLTISSSSYGNDIERATVATIPLYAFMQTDHPLAQRESVSVQELAQQKIVLNSIPIGKKHHVLGLFEECGECPEDIVYLEHIDTLLPTLAKTGGIFIGSMLLTAIPQQHHVFVPITADNFQIDVSLVYLKSNDNPNIPKLIECIGDIRKPRM